MVRQTGENVYDENGMLQQGIIIRQLILPGHTRNSMQALELIKQHFPGVPVSLMSQYTPMGRVLHEPEFADINRRITLPTMLSPTSRKPCGRAARYKIICWNWACPASAKSAAPPANVIYRILHSLTRST